MLTYFGIAEVGTEYLTPRLLRSPGKRLAQQDLSEQREALSCHDWIEVVEIVRIVATRHV